MIIIILHNSGAISAIATESQSLTALEMDVFRRRAAGCRSSLAEHRGDRHPSRLERKCGGVPGGFGGGTGPHKVSVRAGVVTCHFQPIHSEAVPICCFKCHFLPTNDVQLSPEDSAVYRSACQCTRDTVFICVCMSSCALFHFNMLCFGLVCLCACV